MLSEKQKALSEWLGDIKRQLFDLSGDIEQFEKAMRDVPNLEPEEPTLWEPCERCGLPAPRVAGLICCQPCERELDRAESFADALRRERVSRENQ